MFSRIRAGLFDVIVCVSAYYYFGTDDPWLNYLARFVKPGGWWAYASSPPLKSSP